MMTAATGVAGGMTWGVAPAVGWFSPAAVDLAAAVAAAAGLVVLVAAVLVVVEPAAVGKASFHLFS